MNQFLLMALLLWSTPEQDCLAAGGSYNKGIAGDTCNFQAQSWDQSNLKKGDNETACVLRGGIPYKDPDTKLYVECQ